MYANGIAEISFKQKQKLDNADDYYYYIKFIIVLNLIN